MTMSVGSANDRKAVMGYLTALGLAQDPSLDLETALTFHLTSNHYPPIPVEMVPVAMLAITATHAGDWNAEIPLPEGVSYLGATTAPVHALIEHLHLEAWLEEDELD